MFYHEPDTTNPDLHTLVFFTGPGNRDPEFEVMIDSRTLQEVENGFMAYPLDSKVSIGIHFYEFYMINIVYKENGRYLFSTALGIDPDAQAHFYKYARAQIRLTMLKQQEREISYLPNIQTPAGLGLVENVEGHVGSFLTGKTGSIPQQKSKIRQNMKNIAGGARRRTQRRTQWRTQWRTQKQA